MSENLYNEKSIESLSPLEFTRLRPGVYCGDTSYSTQLVVELFSNAVDEFNLGHGNEIKVHYNSKTGFISVEDEGQGFIPNSFRDDGKTILEAAFSVLNTSGKYREDGVYEGTSLGSFGIGSKIATYLSHGLKVSTARDGVEETIVFKEGVFDKRKVENVDKSKHGTRINFLPSEEFFGNPAPDVNALKKLFKETASLCTGLKIIFEVDDEKNIYFSSNGLNDLVDDAVKGKEIIQNRLNYNYEEGKAKINLCLTYTSNYSGTIVPYVNLGLTESGPHITTFKSVLTREINKYAREKKFLKEKDENLSGEDIQEGLYVIFNLQYPGISYDAQVKSRITSKDFNPFITKSLVSALSLWFNNYPKDIKTIIDKALSARKAREAAKKAREAVRKNAEKKTRTILPGKLADCSSKDRSKCEIFIVEGDSAAGSAKEARDRSTQAILPVRGKILNVLKTDLAKAMQNAEIQGMITAFGLEIKDGKIIVDESKLRYGKIIIMSDADVDGAHIRVLFFTFIWKFAPELIEKGYVYAAVPPLYRIIEKKKSFYLKDDAALEQYRASNKSSKYEVQRFKGLGEQSAEELAESTMEPEKRTLKKITMEDAFRASNTFNSLMGESVTMRKRFIEDNAFKANVNI